MLWPMKEIRSRFGYAVLSWRISAASRNPHLEEGGHPRQHRAMHSVPKSPGWRSGRLLSQLRRLSSCLPLTDTPVRATACAAVAVAMQQQ